MTYYALLFVAGFAGSFHCIGMCGGFACALGADPRGASVQPEIAFVGFAIFTIGFFIWLAFLARRK